MPRTEQSLQPLTDEQRDFVAGYKRLLYYAAIRYFWRKSPVLARTTTVDDLAQLGFPGLVRAVQRYDPSRGVQFQTFALWHIRGEISHQIGKQFVVRLPCRAAYKVMGWQKWEPSDGSMNKDVPQQLTDLVSEWLPAIPDEPRLIDQCENVRDYVARLPPRERRLIMLRWFQPRKVSYKRLEKRFGVGKERLRQIEGVALERLRVMQGISTLPRPKQERLLKGCKSVTRHQS